MSAVIVTTLHRGVFFGYATDAEIKHAISAAKHICITNARCAIYWGTERGIGQLAHTGPTETSRIGDRVPMLWLNDVTAIFKVTDAASIRWESVP